MEDASGTWLCFLDEDADSAEEIRAWKEILDEEDAADFASEMLWNDGGGDLGYDPFKFGVISPEGEVTYFWGRAELSVEHTWERAE